MTGYTFELGRVVAGVQLVNLTLHQFDENDYKGRIFTGECPAVPVLIDGVIVDAPQAVKDALALEAYAATLTENAERWVLENQYIILCDALRQAIGQQPDQTAIHEADFPVMMVVLKRGNEAAYNTIRDAFALVTAKLATYEQKWMSVVCYHPQPELQAASLKILELAQ